MVYTPFRTWLQNYGTLFQIRLELLTFLISSATFYSMTLYNSLNFRMLYFLVFVVLQSYL